MEISPGNVTKSDHVLQNPSKEDFNTAFSCAIFVAFKIGQSPCNTISSIRKVIELHFPGMVTNMTQSDQCAMIRKIIAERSEYYQRVKCTTFKPEFYGRKFFVYALIVQTLPELEANCKLQMYDLRKYFKRMMRSPIAFRCLMKCPWLNFPDTFYPGDLKNVEVDLRFGLTLTEDDFYGVPMDDSFETPTLQSDVTVETVDESSRELIWSTYEATDPGIGVTLFSKEIPLPDIFYSEEYSITL